MNRFFGFLTPSKKSTNSAPNSSRRRRQEDPLEADGDVMDFSMYAGFGGKENAVNNHADSHGSNSNNNSNSSNNNFSISSNFNFTSSKSSGKSAPSPAKPSLPSSAALPDPSALVSSPPRVKINHAPRSVSSREIRVLEDLKDFQEINTLAAGTYGRVTLVQHRERGDFYALKIMRKADIVRSNTVHQARRERDTLHAIDYHPFIVKLHHAFQSEKRLYMLMDYVPGGELFFVLRQMTRIPERKARFWVAEVALALEYMQSKGIVYRDLKPENVLVDASGHIRLTDFGFAKQIDSSQTFTLCGTPDYVAPEVLRSFGQSYGVDWWSLGVLTFEMVSGFPPFSGDNTTETFQKILAGVVRFPSYFTPSLKHLIRGLLRLEPSERFSVADVKRHQWFEGVSWSDVLQRRVALADLPWVPPLQHAGDTSHFTEAQRFQENVLKELGKQSDPNHTRVATMSMLDSPTKPQDPVGGGWGDVFDDF